MKYLRKFNENILPYYLVSKDITDFCEMYLAYLVDDGFNISYQPGNQNSKAKGGPVTYVTICFNKTHNRPVVTFSGDEIEDRFIPFVHMLNKNYEILDIIIFNKNEQDPHRYIEYKPTIEEILNGEIGFKEIVQINIKVKLDFKV
jgi:hypothetical protein